MQGTSIRFAAAARTLTRASRARGLEAPGFRTPPRLDGVARTVRRAGSGGSVVAVQTRGRPWVAVLGDMIEGIVVANGMHGAEATRVRTALWSAVEGELDRTAA